ncbi:hypothetical protein CO038_01120 [Candidatus Pacearchaeota archaeon CG_4_9_14_0_2_um_filter_39_13]|nr:glycosyltransferase family 9 protein [Candidatus Pacearchaeota archaeon]OIO43200.1 MAG: hypothetical protein AUJ64_02540 [Candidatus Pacearchaeota archaeon CG1_02_39_14]PJC44895.1 MAG: hypothetical protein CO038_01120 [Candidatus Pacearchaeota archaeon CG_4_9_14_0_2_um_filter_39_13]
MFDWIFKLKNQIHMEARKIASAFDYLLWFLFDSARIKNLETRKIKNILVVLVNQEKGNVGGDFVTLGVLNSFKKQHPQINLSVFCDRSTIKQFGRAKMMNFIEYSGKDSLNKLRKKKIQAVVFLNPGNLNTNDFSFIPYRVGTTHFGLRGLMRRKSFGYTRKTLARIGDHMVGGRFRMFEALGFKFREKKPFLEFTRQENKKADSFIRKNNLSKFIIIHPGGKYVSEAYKEGKWPPHLWNLERYAEVADHFSQKGYKIVVTGTKSEQILFDEIKKHCRNKEMMINACGMLSIREVGCLLKKTSLLIATDTSIVHLAYQYPINARIVELMGSSIPESVGAWPTDSPRHRILVDRGRCYKSMRKLPFRDNYNCLKNIGVDQVINAAESLLKEKQF